MEASKPEGRTKPTEYVVLVQDSDSGDYRLVADDNGDPAIFKAYRQEQVFEDLVNDGTVAEQEDGKTPFVAPVPTRSWKPRRATISTRKRVDLD